MLCCDYVGILGKGACGMDLQCEGLLRVGWQLVSFVAAHGVHCYYV